MEREPRDVEAVGMKAILDGGEVRKGKPLGVQMGGRSEKIVDDQVKGASGSLEEAELVLVKNADAWVFPDGEVGVVEERGDGREEWVFFDALDVGGGVLGECCERTTVGKPQEKDVLCFGGERVGKVAEQVLSLEVVGMSRGGVVVVVNGEAAVGWGV